MTTFFYHKAGCIIPCSSFLFKLTDGKTTTWICKNYFSCDSNDTIYNLICKTCDVFYLGQTQSFKQRIAKQKSEVKISHNITCRISSEHLRDFNQVVPYFQIVPF